MKSNQTIIIEDRLAKIERRYNPERDLIPGGPDVTWCDAEMVGIIKHLVIVVEDLQDQIDAMASTGKYSLPN
jgi:hypothetical protein